MSEATVTIGGNTQKISPCLADSTATSASKPNGTTHTYEESTSPDGRAHQERRTRASEWIRMPRRSVGGGATERERDHCALRNADAKRILHECRTTRARAQRASRQRGSLFDSITRSRRTARPNSQRPTPNAQPLPTVNAPKKVPIWEVGNWEWLAVGSWPLGVRINPATAGLMRLSAWRRGIAAHPH